MADDKCKACGSGSLWRGLLTPRGDETTDHTIPGVRETAICEGCGQVQDRPVRVKR